MSAQQPTSFRHILCFHLFDPNNEPRNDWYEQADGGWYEVNSAGMRNHFSVFKSPFVVDGVPGKLVKVDVGTGAIFIADDLRQGTYLSFWSADDLASKPLPLGQIRVLPPTSVAWTPPERPILTGDALVQRDRMIGPALTKFFAGNPGAAFDDLRTAVSSYPQDPTVLMLAARAALASSKPLIAFELYNRALATQPPQPWTYKVGRMKAEAALGKWADFARDQADLLAAKKASVTPGKVSVTPDLSLDGFEIEQFTVNGVPISTVYFPLMAGKYNTLYRFVLPRIAPAPQTRISSTTTTTPDRCSDPNFQPYIDLESDTADQVRFKQQHPDLAAKGIREYSLDSYTTPCSQGLIRFYTDGAPNYADLRSTIIQALSPKPKAP
jgi:hypothetical protein